jgi:hypothetical protein
MAEDDGSINYGWYLTMDEMLCQVIEHCEAARNLSEPLQIKVQLRMATAALKGALEVYGSVIEVQTKEKP